MARFLSPAWIAELDAVAGERSAPLADALAGVTLVVERQVHGGPAGDVAYVTRIDDGRVRIESGSAADADLVIVSDYATAAALARGELNAQQAFSAGRLKVRGRIDRLASQARALAAVDVGLDGVRASTAFDD